MNKYVIEARYVAETHSDIVTQKGKILKFDSEELAREWGHKELKLCRYVAGWDAITEKQAKERGHEI